LRKTKLPTDDVIEAIVSRTGQPEGVVRAWFSQTEEKFFTAQEAVNLGLADGFFELPPTNASPALS